MVEEGQFKKCATEYQESGAEFVWLETIEEAAKEFPTYPEPLDEKEFSQKKWDDLLDIWDSKVQKWFVKWFGSQASLESEKSEQKKEVMRINREKHEVKPKQCLYNSKYLVEIVEYHGTESVTVRALEDIPIDLDWEQTSTPTILKGEVFTTSRKKLKTGN